MTTAPRRRPRHPGEDDRVVVPLAEKSLPINVEMEQAVLGALLNEWTEPQAKADILALLKPADFFRGDHQVIYRAALDLHADGKPVEFLTVDDLLVDRGESEKVGGLDALKELADA